MFLKIFEAYVIRWEDAKGSHKLTIPETDVGNFAQTLVNNKATKIVAELKPLTQSISDGPNTPSQVGTE